MIETKQELTDRGEITVLYMNGSPVGHLRGGCYKGVHAVELRCCDRQGNRISIAFAGATMEGVLRNLDSIEGKYLKDSYVYMWE